MKRLICISLVAAAMGCDNLPALLNAARIGSDEITLRLINDAAGTVEPSVFVDGLVGDLLIDQLTEGVVTLSTNNQDFADLAAGEVRTVTYDCDDFKAFKVENAELRSALINADADSELLVEDDDFECGDVITIRYGGGVTGLSVSISVGRIAVVTLLDVLFCHESQGSDAETVQVASSRQHDALERAQNALRQGDAALAEGLAPELVVEHCRETLVALGEITGEDYTEALLDQVFARFCVGK